MKKMLKAALNLMLGLCLSLSLTGCATIDGLKLMVGNQYASHNWNGSQTQTTLPLEYLNEHTIVNTSVNGVTNLRMVLDTGAAATVVFETDKTKPLLNNLDRKFTVGGIGEGKGTFAYFMHDNDLALGSLTISGLSMVFIKAEDNPLFANPDVTYIDGVIGYDVFSRFSTEVNFTNETVTVSEGQIGVKEGYGSLPITIKNNLPYTSISLTHNNTATELPVIFDTGGIGPLLVNSGQNIPQGEELHHSTSLGLGGENKTSINRFDSVELGQFQVPNVIGAVSQNASSSTKSNILGTGLINRFNLIVDYPSKQILLSPNHRFAEPDVVNVLGVTLFPHTQGAYIEDIRADSAAEKLGLQKGSVIVSVNGEAIDYQNYDAVKVQLQRWKTVTELCYVLDKQKVCQSVTS